MRVILDRFEEDFVLVELENKDIIHMPKELVPKGAKEGNVIEIRIDIQETLKRKERIDNLMNDLWD